MALFCKDKQQTMIRQELFMPLYQCPHGWLWQYLRSSLLHRNSSSSHWSSVLCGWVFQLGGGKCQLWGSLSRQRQRRRGSCNVLLMEIESNLVAYMSMKSIGSLLLQSFQLTERWLGRGYSWKGTLTIKFEISLERCFENWANIILELAFFKTISRT